MGEKQDSRKMMDVKQTRTMNRRTEPVRVTERGNHQRSKPALKDRANET